MDNKRYTEMKGLVRMFLDPSGHKVIVVEEKFSKSMSPCAVLMYPEGVAYRFIVVNGLYEDAGAKLDWDNQESFEELIPAVKYFKELLKSE